MSHKLISVAVVGILIIIAGMLLATRPQNENQLTFGCPKNICILPLIAQDQGYFEKYGLEVEIRKLLTGKITMDSVLAGDVDLGTLVDSNVGFIGFQPQTKLRVLTSIAHRKNQVIVALGDIEPADLQGKRVAHLPGTSSHIFLARMLDKHGIAWDEVNHAVMTPPVMQNAIARGDVDAVSFWQPWWFNAVTMLDQQGKSYTELQDAELYPSQVVIAAHADTLATRPQQLQNFLKALLAAERFIENNRAEAITIVAHEVDIAREVVEQTWHLYGPTVDFTNTFSKLINEHGEWIRTTQEAYIGKPQPDYERLLRPELLQAIAPERVTLELH